MSEKKKSSTQKEELLEQVHRVAKEKETSIEKILAQLIKEMLERDQMELRGPSQRRTTTKSRSTKRDSKR